MRDALNATGRPILFSLCSWGSGGPHEWGQQVWTETSIHPFQVAFMWEIKCLSVPLKGEGCLEQYLIRFPLPIPWPGWQFVADRYRFVRGLGHGTSQASEASQLSAAHWNRHQGTRELC
jgi:hypothetical protein